MSTDPHSVDRDGRAVAGLWAVRIAAEERDGSAGSRGAHRALAVRGEHRGGARTPLRCLEKPIIELQHRNRHFTTSSCSERINQHLNTSHADLRCAPPSFPQVLNLKCTDCGKPCRSQTEQDLHTKRTGHATFVDKVITTLLPRPCLRPVTPIVACSFRLAIDRPTSTGRNPPGPVDKY